MDGCAILFRSVYASNVKLSSRLRLCETVRWWESREKFCSPHIGQVLIRRFAVDWVWRTLDWDDENKRKILENKLTFYLLLHQY